MVRQADRQTQADVERQTDRLADSKIDKKCHFIEQECNMKRSVMKTLITLN